MRPQPIDLGLPVENSNFTNCWGQCIMKPAWPQVNLGSCRFHRMRSREAISEETRRNGTLRDRKTVVATLNRMMIGWANYFCPGPVSTAYRAVERHARQRLRQWE